MDFISYRGLALNVATGGIQSLPHERAPQLDSSRSTYRDTRWLISALVTYNPGVVSYAPAGAGGIPGAAPGRMPPLTDNAIRSFLEQPRGVLIVRNGSNPALFPGGGLTIPTNDPASLVLVSPANGRVCDARTGPICKVHSIQQIPGERLWKIHLTFETYVNESPGALRTGVLGGNLILSNRWSVHADVNWQHLTTRVYQGICTVNGGLLREAAQVANNPGLVQGLIDSLRPTFAGFTVPFGYQRTYVNVQLTPDGNNAVYVVRDEQQMYSKPGDVNIPRIEIQDSNWIRQVGWGAAVAANLPGWGTIGAAAASIPFLATPLAPAVVAGWSLYTFNASTNMVTAMLPKMSRTVIVRAWGNTRKNRNSLVSAAIAVAAARLGRPALFDTTTSELLITGDTNQLVTVVWTAKWGSDAAFGQWGNLIIDGVPTFAPGITGGPGVLSWRDSAGQIVDVQTANNVTIRGASLSNPPFPTGSGTGGTSAVTGIAPLIAQTLESFGAAPGAVP